MTQLYLDKLKTGRTRLQVKKHEKKKANHKSKHEANIALYTINNIQPQHRKKTDPFHSNCHSTKAQRQTS